MVSALFKRLFERQAQSLHPNRSESIRSSSAKRALVGLGLASFLITPARAEWGLNHDSPPTPRVNARSETTLRLFQRALLPGPGGALVATDTLIPITEYWSVSAHDLPSAIDGESLSAELSGWANGQFLDRGYETRLNFDITSAWVRQTWGPAFVILGRQTATGGAARYARFDGARGGFRTMLTGAWRLGAEAYAGYTVLPRWDDRPGYYYLGATADSLTIDRETLGDPSRAGSFLFGARSELSRGSTFFAALSFHQQHAERALERRDLGGSASLAFSEQLDWTADVVVDTDSWWIATARTWLDFVPAERWSTSVEYLHTEPRLLLARQSVLSVFDTSGFDEVGLSATYQPWSHLDLSGHGYVEWYAGGELGARARGRVGAFVDRGRTTRITLGYSRVHLASGGYHALRTTLSKRVLVPLRVVGEVYAYWYDRPINERHSSNVYAANLVWSRSSVWQASWGGSLAQTPYARSDLQTLLRFSIRGDLWRGTR